MKNNRSITVSAPGKLLLMGDHAVVYGYPCIVSAVNQRMYSTVSRLENPEFVINAPDVNIIDYKKLIDQLGSREIPKGARFIEAAVKNFIEHYPVSGGISISTQSEFSSEYGFGSSSASIVSVLFGLFTLFEKPCSAVELFDMAYKTVLEVQSVGSGFDIACAIWGGTIYFDGKTKHVTPLSCASIPLVVGYSGIKADTATIVREVAKKYKTNTEKMDRIFIAIGQLVTDAKIKIEEGDWERVGKLMEFDQEYLRDLGVSSEKLETLISAAKNAGAFGSKLSGAGGGDCMISIVSPKMKHAVELSITQAGGTIVAVAMGAQGVMVESTDDQEELLIVVDERDEIIGYRTRGECHTDPSLIHRTVGIIITNERGDILLQKRSQTKDMDAGLWGISAAGHVTKGQTDEEAAHRELQEELGVDAALEFVDKFFLYTEAESERAVLFKGIHNGPFVIHEDEVEKIEWMSADAIRNSKELLFTQGAKQALQSMGVLA